MANNKMMQGVTEGYDDFTGAFSSATNGQIASKCHYVLGTGTISVDRLAINGSAARITGDTNEAADISLYGPRAFQPDQAGKITFQTRLRVNGNGSSMTPTSTFIGFVNADTNSLNLNYEDAAVVSTPTDGFGIVFEPEQNAGWYTIGTGNSVDDTVRIDNNIEDLAIATFVTVEIEADNNNDSTTGVVRYRVKIDGKILKTAVTDALGWTISKARSAQIYAPVVATAGRATAYTTDVCEMYWSGGKGASLD